MQQFDLDRPWALGGQVALRPESFGALAYDFSTRRLSFLKSPTLLEIVSSLGDHATAREACAAAGVEDAKLGRFLRALETLASTEMIVERESA